MSIIKTYRLSKEYIPTLFKKHVPVSVIARWTNTTHSVVWYNVRKGTKHNA